MVEQSNHTKSFLPAGRSQTTVIAKRDVGQQNAPCCSKWRQAPNMPETNKMAELEETATSEDESKTMTTSTMLNDQHQSETTTQTKWREQTKQQKKEANEGIDHFETKDVEKTTGRTSQKDETTTKSNYRTKHVPIGIRTTRIKKINKNPEISEGKRREDENRARKRKTRR